MLAGQNCGKDFQATINGVNGYCRVTSKLGIQSFQLAVCRQTTGLLMNPDSFFLLNLCSCRKFF